MAAVDHTMGVLHARIISTATSKVDGVVTPGSTSTHKPAQLTTMRIDACLARSLRRGNQWIRIDVEYRRQHADGGVECPLSALLMVTINLVTVYAHVVTWQNN